MDTNETRNVHTMPDLFGDGSFDRLIELLSGMVITDPEEIEKVNRAEEARLALREREEEQYRLLFAGFPKRAVLALDTLAEGNPAWMDARAQLGNFHRLPGAIVALHGPCGTGKTVMATSLARGLSRKGRTIAYVKAYDFCLALRDEKNRERDIMNRYQRPFYLVLDEFHELKRSDFAAYAIDRLVDARHQDGKMTVIISNLRGEEVEPTLGAAITSRMHDAGGRIPCEWPSYREGRYA